MTNATRTWIVGLDLSPRSRGAVSFAKLLAERNGDALFGVHVLEEAHLHAALRYHHLAEVEAAALAAATTFVEGLGATAAVGSIEIAKGRTAEETLTASAEARSCDGIVIGRNAESDETAIVRLGRVARRLLRTLPRTVAVVPPDYDPATTGQGPVVLATDFGDDTASVSVAKDLAARLGRPLHVVHVAASPERHAAQYLPEATLAKLRAETEQSSGAELEAWATKVGVGDAARFVTLGAIVPGLLGHASRHDACAIVTGSRRLTGLERLLIASAGTELASHAACPVLVVPPV